jgi:hypothetical protein
MTLDYTASDVVQSIYDQLLYRYPRFSTEANPKFIPETLHDDMIQNQKRIKPWLHLMLSALVHVFQEGNAPFSQRPSFYHLSHLPSAWKHASTPRKVALFA